MTFPVRIPPAWRPLARGDGSVQLGARPEDPLVLTDLNDAEVAYLQAVSLPLSEGPAASVGERCGLPPHQERRLVERLRTLGVLQDTTDPELARAMSSVRRERLRPLVLRLQSRGAPDAWAVADRRDRATVVIDVDPLAASLPADRDSVSEQLARDVGGHFTQHGVGEVLMGARTARWWHDFGDTADPGTADLVLALFLEVPDAVSLRPLRAAGVPHLPVTLGPSSLHLGPVVGAPPSPVMPCSECLEAHRQDADPAWGHVAMSARWGGPVGGRSLGRQPGSLVTGAIEWITRTGLWVVDGRAREEPTGWVMRMDAGDPLPRVQRFPRHPSCPCRLMPPPGSSAVDRGGVCVPGPSPRR